jgi:hypothetical protein
VNFHNGSDVNGWAYLAWNERIQYSPLANALVASLEGCATGICRRTFDLPRKESPE